MQAMKREELDAVIKTLSVPQICVTSGFKAFAKLLCIKKMNLEWCILWDR